MGNLVLAGATSGSITLEPTAVAGTNTITLPALTGTVLTSASPQSSFPTGIAGTGPAFSAYTNSSQTATGGVATKVLFQVEEYDTNNNFASSRFTATIAGYYQFSTALECGAGAQNYAAVTFWRNGSEYARGTNYPASASAGPVLIGSALIYLNTTDFVEVYVAANNNISVSNIPFTKFQGVLVRSA